MLDRIVRAGSKDGIGAAGVVTGDTTTKRDDGFNGSGFACAACAAS